MKSPLLVPALAALLLGACEKKQDLCRPEQYTPVTTQPVSPVVQMNIGRPPGTQTLVINSAADLAAVPLPGVQRLTIDFTRYTLLGVLPSRTGGIWVGAQTVSQDCGGNYYYHTEVGDGPIAMPSSCFYGVLVDKIPASAQINFDVQER